MAICEVHSHGMAGKRMRDDARRGRQAAFTLTELLIVIALIGALAAIAIPNYREYRERANVAKAITDITSIAQALKAYENDNRTYPASLTALGITLPTDPWGRAYVYLAIDIVPPPNTGQKRKDKNLNPLNSDYDLYSMGPDGQTQKQLTAAKARDDIVRADNGRFIDVASKH
ncbi:MAG: type II secretion system protein GspG [Sulfuritalea sp.]|nr:type II secretion system protein GspG [Sulfuritalea sp.]